MCGASAKSRSGSEEEVFSVGQDFASVEAWDTGSGHYDVVRYTKHTTESFKGLVETLLKQFTAD